MDLLITIGLLSIYLGIGVFTSAVMECETDGQALVFTIAWPVLLIIIAVVVLLTLVLAAIETTYGYLSRKLGGK